MLAALLFVIVLMCLAVFQVALVLGAPLGRFTWGGQHAGAVPVGLRIAAASSVLVYAVMATLALDRVGTMSLYPDFASQVGMWVVFVFLVLNAVPNAISRSSSERYVMTPVLVLMSVLALLIALS